MPPPAAGLTVPEEVVDLRILSKLALVADGDEGAAEIDCPLRDDVATIVTTDSAHAIVDRNRAPDDFRKDGVIKIHACFVNQYVR
jgi:N-formylglutamate amidohydrolase